MRLARRNERGNHQSGTQSMNGGNRRLFFLYVRIETNMIITCKNKEEKKCHFFRTIMALLIYLLG